MHLINFGSQSIHCSLCTTNVRIIIKIISSLIRQRIVQVLGRSSDLPNLERNGSIAHGKEADGRLPACTVISYLTARESCRTAVSSSQRGGAAMIGSEGMCVSFLGTIYPLTPPCPPAPGSQGVAQTGTYPGSDDVPSQQASQHLGSPEDHPFL